MPRKKAAKRSYHSGSVYRNSPTSKTWTVSWRENGTREREGGFTSKGEGQAWLDNVVLPNLLAGKPGRPSTAEVLSGNKLSVVVERWFRTRTVVSKDSEFYNWRGHLEPFFGDLLPSQLDSVKLAAWVLERLGDEDLEDEDGVAEEPEEGRLSPGTVTNIVRLVSTLYTDLIDQGIATNNPAKSLPKSIKRRLKSDHDPATTPFIRHLSTVFAIINELQSPFSVAYAIGALAGLRTGEVLGLDWESIDLDPKQRKIVVRQQVQKSRLRRPKSKKSRTVLIVDALYPILLEYHKKTGGTGLLFRPVIKGYSAYPSPNSTRKYTAQWTLARGVRKYAGGFDSLGEAEAFARLQAQAQPVRAAMRGGLGDSVPKYMAPKTLHNALDNALEMLGIPRLAWIHATRHSFSSQWVLNGGDMNLLQRLLGHQSITTTLRYAHLQTDFFQEKDYKRLTVDASYIPVATPITANNVTEMDVSSATIAFYVASTDA